MNTLSHKQASKSNEVSKKTSHAKAGLFLFVSIFTVTNTYADGKQDEVELEAFYQQVFGKKKKNVTNKPTNIFSQKDPELVGFYKKIFGKNYKPKPKPQTAKTKITAKLVMHRVPSKVKALTKNKSLSAADMLQELIDDVNQPTSTPLSTNKKTTVKTKQVQKVTPRPIPSTKNTSSQKDPELIAFYEQVFGKIHKHQSKNKTPIVNVTKTKKIIKSKLSKPISGQKPATKTVELQGLINNLKDTNVAVVKKNKQAINTKRTSSSATQNSEQVISKAGKPSVVNHNPDVETIKTTKTTELQGLINNLKTTKNKTPNNKIATLPKHKAIPSLSQNAHSPALSNQSVNSEEDSADKEPPQNNKASDLNALFAKAFGKKTAASAPSKVSVDLKINKIILGDVTVYSNKQGILDRVDTKTLLSLLKNVLKEHVYERVLIEISKKGKVRFRALKKLGVRATYNPVDLSVDLKINSNLRKPLVLSMQAKKNASVREENKIKSDEISAFLNMYSNVGLNSGSTKPDLKMKLEGSLNIGNTVLESTIDLRSGKFSSDKVMLTYDKPDTLQRFTIGNVSSGNRNFQENLKLDGIRISKEFFMDPDLQIRPRANESFVLDSDSEVEVFINRQLRQRFYLRAGIYSLEDIGLYDGANNIRVRIKDEFGKVTIKTSQQYYDSHLLKKDLSLYAVSVGYLSSKQVGSENQLLKKPILSGYYQKGLTKDLTMSFDAQISTDSYLVGSEIITSAYLGSIKTSVAMSGGVNNNTGFATRFEFKPNKQRERISLDTLREDMLGLQNSASGFLKNWTLSGEYRSRDFSLLSQSDSFNIDTDLSKKKLKARLQTNFSLDLLDDWRGTLNVGVSDYYESPESLSANLTATKRFHNGMSLSLGARYDSDDDFSMNLQLSIPFSTEKGKRKKNLDFLANSRDNSFESKLSVKPTSQVGKNSLGGSIEHIQNDKTRQQNLDVYYRGSSFETKLSARNSFGNNNDESSQQLNIGFNSSLACVGKNCATSYPINDSFALVSGPSNQNGPIAINNGNRSFQYSDENDSGLPDSYSALIPNNRSKAVVQLESYKFQNINIDESTLPDGYDTDKTEFEVFPRYHQGFLIKAGGEPATILNGILVNQNKKPLSYKGGQWTPVNGKGKAIAFFSNKAGRFRITSIPTGNYKLELFDYPDMQAINVSVPDLKGKMHDIGNVIIKE